jgi:hypothetical protein
VQGRPTKAGHHQSPLYMDGFCNHRAKETPDLAGRLQGGFELLDLAGLIVLMFPNAWLAVGEQHMVSLVLMDVLSDTNGTPNSRSSSGCSNFRAHQRFIRPRFSQERRVTQWKVTDCSTVKVRKTHWCRSYRSGGGVRPCDSRIFSSCSLGGI